MPTPKRNWIVMAGQPVMSTDLGGFEFFGPFTEAEAKKLLKQITDCLKMEDAFSKVVMAVELLGYYNRQLSGEAQKAGKELPL